MLITYDEFCQKLLNTIQSGDDFYLELVKTVIDNPARYCGLFRLSNAKTKLIQNVTQSKEIKFGDLIEEISTEYISKLGYTNFDKNLGADANGDVLNVDQYFTDGKTIFMAEMKIRDDHDSTKKRGQYSNFEKKIRLIKSRHPNQHIDASMWFVDDGLVKNKNYYQSEMDNEHFDNCSLHLYYGGSFFESLNNGKEAWNELVSILKEYRKDNSSVDVDIPDFGSSEEILKALVNLPYSYWNKLLSTNEKYVLLRNELFGSGNNISKAKEIRANKS
ncbi:MAG: restriction endonuclease [Bacilli bacterium]|jgi:hypothetical protein